MVTPPRTKPIDVGTGQVGASFDVASAAWLSVGTPHAHHGFVELSGVPRFDEQRRGDAAATRSHRLAMTAAAHAVLAVEIAGERPALAVERGGHWTAPGVRASVAAGDDTATLRQSWTVDRSSGRPPAVELHLAGYLDRPALAEITELSPPPPTAAATRLDVDPDGPVVVEAPGLPASVTIGVENADVRWVAVEGGARGTVAWPDAGDLRFAITMRVTTMAVASSAPDPPPPDPDRVVEAALAYARGCTGLAVAVDERVLLTDHRILPLSWTRDAYWQALALIVAAGPGDHDRVADHLRWLWRRCDRPDGLWARSHHADGRRKDLAFQADQQLYPIVELADVWRATGRLPDGVDWNAEVTRSWQAVVAEVDAELGLIPSAETAADDPVEAPFIGASQILLWYAAERTRELAEARALALDAAWLRTLAERARAAFDLHIATNEGGPWAYAVDGTGRRVDYHDANDLPVALAPLWGFCGAADPGWRATMSFAFSPANPGWVVGRRAGLGSVHTPGTWTLGDVQAWIRAVVVGDRAAMAETEDRLEEVAFADGMLPEAYDPDTLDPIRHWFAWPGAALAALRLIARDRRLDGLRVGTGR